jgi:hypothetical protein
MSRSQCWFVCAMLAIVVSLSGCNRKNDVYGLAAQSQGTRMLRSAEPTAVAAFAPTTPPLRWTHWRTSTPSASRLRES